MTQPTLFDVDDYEAAAPSVSVAPDAALTATQRLAVGERSHSMLLSAGAGTGKTHVLVERLVAAVLDDGLAPASILAITFTEKAAGELAVRVRRRFLELGKRDEAQASEQAFIATIHGFCGRLLRTHALAAGLDPAFSVLDEPHAARLRAEAFEDGLRTFLTGAAGERLDLVAAYRADRLADMILAAHDELRSRGQAEPRLPPIQAPLPPDAERAELAAASAAFAAELASVTPSKRVDAAHGALARCARLLDDLEAGVVPWPGRIAALQVVCGGAKALGTDACLRYVDARDAFERACADHHAARALELIDELLGLYGAAYAARKDAAGALDFDDLELRARDLFAEHPGIAREWRERFDLLMVDEFQDCNARQVEILEAIEDDNLFCVGDEFQSIYGFRHADVEQFRRRREQLRTRGLAPTLADSFRSRAPLLDVIDRVFKARFGGDFTPLLPARSDAGDRPGPLVELLVTATTGWDDDVDLGDSLPPVQRWRQAEARLVAQRVRELVDEGETSPADVAVLVRASNSMPVLERALEDAGLPTLATAGRGFWSRQQVVDLVSYLAALANALDEPALMTVLASPLAGVSSDALAIMIAAARARGRDLWWQLRAMFIEGEDGGEDGLAGVSSGDRQVLESFVPRFAAERRQASLRGASELLERAIAAAGYDLTILAQHGGRRRLANVTKLLRIARSYEAAEGGGARGFVDHVGLLERAQRREPEAPVEDPAAQAVRLMTIHAAKGLEFGTVVVADLGRGGHSRSPNLIVDGARIGFRLSMLDGGKGVPALDHAALATERLVAERAEEDRILYVACTRARDRLLLSGAADSARWPQDGGTSPAISWLGPALVGDVAARLGNAEPANAIAADLDGVRLVLSTPGTLGAALRDAAPSRRGESGPPARGDGAAVSPPPAVVPRTAAAIGALSYSSLSDYARCGYRFYTERILSLPRRDAPAVAAPAAIPGSGLDARVRGVVVHGLIEELDVRAPQPPGADRIRALAAEEGATASDDDISDVRRLVAASCDSAIGVRLAAAVRLRREHEFSVEMTAGSGGPQLLTGIVDAVAVEHTGGWLVVDAKTDRVAPRADLEALTERSYGVQRRLYALAALRAGAPEVEVVHHYLERAGEPAVAHYVAADADSIERDLSVLTDALHAGLFPLAIAPHAGLCATCPARGSLCPYSAALTLRAAPEEAQVADAPTPPR